MYDDYGKSTSQNNYRVGLRMVPNKHKNCGGTLSRIPKSGSGFTWVCTCEDAKREDSGHGSGLQEEKVSTRLDRQAAEEKYGSKEDI